MATAAIGNPFGRVARPTTCSTFINARRMELVRRLEELPASCQGEPAYQTAVEALDAAGVAVEERIPVRRWLSNWWSGEHVERSWTVVHQAEDAIAELESDHALLQDIPQLREQLLAVVGSRDRRYTGWSAEMDAIAKDRTLTPFERQALARIRLGVHRATDDRHRAVRGFRNLVLATSLAITVLLVGAAVWHVVNHGVFSLCMTADGKTTCLDGGSTSHSVDVGLVIGMGLLSGLVSGLLSLGRMRVVRSPYNLPSAQILLKAVAGAATALLGIIILQSGLVVDAASSTGVAVLAYAVLFGSSQELFTRMVDDRASKLTGAES